MNEQTLIKTNKEQKQGMNEMQDKKFIALKDLLAEDVKKLAKIPFTFKISKTKSGQEIKAITFLLHEKYLKAVPVAPSGERLTQDRFDLISLSIELNDLDVYGRPQTEWHKKVPVRFVKGTMKNGSNYYAIEIIYKQYLYDIHFFNSNSDQLRTLQLLEQKGHLKIDWVSRPDSIEDIDFSDLSFI